MWVVENEEKEEVLERTKNNIVQIMTGCPDVPEDHL